MALPVEHHGYGAPEHNTLDIGELQGLVRFQRDANNLNYHHRIMWYRVGGAKWIVSSPDRDTYVEDFFFCFFYACTAPPRRTM